MQVINIFILLHSTFWIATMIDLQTQKSKFWRETSPEDVDIPLVKELNFCVLK